MEKPNGKARVAGYKPDELIKAPLAVPKPGHTQAERDALQDDEPKAPRRAGAVLIILGVGFVLLDVWAMMFLPTFRATSVVLMLLEGFIFISGGMALRRV